MSWRESPDDAWKREARRSGWRRIRAALLGGVAYALTLAAILGLVGAWKHGGRTIGYILGLVLVFLALLFVFGIPALAGWAVYKRALQNAPTPNTADPRHRPRTF